jgi:hypothetical protein
MSVTEWQCDEPGCARISHGGGSATGLRAIGWEVTLGGVWPILRCPDHTTSGHNPGCLVMDEHKNMCVLAGNHIGACDFGAHIYDATDLLTEITRLRSIVTKLTALTHRLTQEANSIEKHVPAARKAYRDISRELLSICREFTGEEP